MFNTAFFVSADSFNPTDGFNVYDFLEYPSVEYVKQNFVDYYNSTQSSSLSYDNILCSLSGLTDSNGAVSVSGFFVYDYSSDFELTSTDYGSKGFNCKGTFKWAIVRWKYYESSDCFRNLNHYVDYSFSSNETKLLSSANLKSLFFNGGSVYYSDFDGDKFQANISIVDGDKPCISFEVTPPDSYTDTYDVYIDCDYRGSIHTVPGFSLWTNGVNGNFEKNVSVTKFKTWWSSLSNFDLDIDDSIQLSLIAQSISKDGSLQDAANVRVTLTYDDIQTALENTEDSDDGVFSEKWDYPEWPDTSDYFNDQPEFPGFDPEHPIESIWNIVKWVGQLIIYNLSEVCRLIKDYIVTSIKMVIVALHNLIVDFKNLLTYLFVPDNKNMEKIVDKKFPSFSKVLESLENIKNGNYTPVSFELLDNTYTFDLGSIPDGISSTTYSFSTIVCAVLELYIIIKCIYKAFGVNVSSSEGE